MNPCPLLRGRASNRQARSTGLEETCGGSRYTNLYHDLEGGRPIDKLLSLSFPVDLSMDSPFRSLSRSRRFPPSGAVRGLVPVLCFAVLPLTAAIRGKVVNATTGKPVPSAAVTLIKFGGSQGMAPAAEMYTESDGGFSFDEKTLGSGNSPVHAMLRAEYEGISYSKMIVPDSPLENVVVEVYSIAKGETLDPHMTALLFEPGDDRLVINQFFQFSNESDPPRTYSDPDNGTLRFELPPGSNGEVQVRTTGPAGMPLRSSARKTPESNVYMVDCPLKPGDNLIELTYSFPYESGEPHFGRVLYKGLETRFVVPEGVTLEADDVNLIGNEPQTQASIYRYEGAPEFSIRLRGQGALSEDTPGGGGGGTEITIAPALVAKELPWIFAVTGIILALGFYNLLVSRVSRDNNADADEPAQAPTSTSSINPPMTAGKRRPSRAARRRR